MIWRDFLNMAFTLRKVGGSRFDGRQFENDGSHSSSVGPFGVWGSEGKIYISSDEGKQLIVTDSVPRSRWAESYTTVVENSSSPVVAVLPNPISTTQIYIIYRNSMIDCMEHDPTKNQLVKKHTFQLSNAKGAEILSVSLHPKTSMFFWCERRGSNLGLGSYCVCMREVPESWHLEFLSCIGPVVALLHSCPVMSLLIINKGVCMMPSLPNEQKQLVFFWTFVPRSLKVYVWNNTTIGDLDKTDFKSIIMHLLPVWNSSMDNEHIISVTTHPTTLELIILDNNFSLSCASIQDGELSIQKLCTLSVFKDIKHNSIEHFFTVSLFVGLVLDSGSINIYDSKSGASLCAFTDLTDQKLNIWTYFGSIHSIGVWAKECIWELKYRSVSDVAKVMQNSKVCNYSTKPCTLNNKQDSPKDEKKKHNKCCVRIQCSNCFPGMKSNQGDPYCVCCHQNGTLSGPVTATMFLDAWGMGPLAANVALGTVVSQILGGSSEDLYGAIDKELLEILLGNSFQSPVVALSLLHGNPWYKNQVVMAVKKFSESFENASEELDKEVIKTTLNESLYLYMKQFLALSEKFDEIVDMKNMRFPSSEQVLVSGHTEVKEIFQKLNLSNPDCQSLSRLSYLQSGCSQEMHQTIAHLIGLGVNDVTSQEMKLYSQRWRNIFRLEWKDGRWQKHCAVFETPINPTLGLICNLLYNEEPDWLLRVHENGMAVVNAKDSDERAQDHVTHSILDCLPSLIMNPSPQSTQAHAILLWSAGQEMQAMQIMLRHQMWSQALDFFSALEEDTNSLTVLFIMIFKDFLRCKAPKEVLLKALSLIPQGLCVNEILLLLQNNGPKSSEPFVQDSNTLTVGDVKKYLRELLKHN